MRSIKHNDLKSFINTRLISRLSNDFCRKPFRIFRERDLHACCYYHLRRYLDGDHRWVILNEPNLRGLKGREKNARPDILILFTPKPSAPVPKILIELKFRNKHTGSKTKDTKILWNSVSYTKKWKKWVNKSYYIETVIDPVSNDQPKVKKRRNKVAFIPMKSDRLEEYKQQYREFRAPQRRKRGRK